MSFKDNLKSRIGLDKLVGKINAGMRETQGKRYVNKDAVRDLLAMTGFKHIKTRDLHLYAGSPEEGAVGEVLVLDNELPIYRSTVEDVAMRKTPNWKEMLRIANIKKILNDSDVIIRRGRQTIERLYEDAASRLDLSCTEEDLKRMAGDARRAFDARSRAEVAESLELFLELLGFEAVALGAPEGDFSMYSRPGLDRDDEEILYEDWVLFSDSRLDLLLLKGSFPMDSDMAIAEVIQCARGERRADFKGAEVFDYLAELALRNHPGMMNGYSAPPPV